jgi:hypothetical protein
MNRKHIQARPLIFLSLLLSLEVASQATAANMRSFIEAVRRNATVVYIGSVRDVRELGRNKFDIKARAVVSIFAVARGPGNRPAEATFEYSSYDDKTPMLAGGPQYQLRPGTTVIVFADSFENATQPKYLMQGSREELLERVKGLRDNLKRMPPDELQRNEIGENDRQVQVALYEKLAGQVAATK